MLKPVVLLLTSLITCLALRAQPTSGTVYFQNTFSFGDMKIENVPSEVAALFPSSSTSSSVLYFTPERSLYETLQNDAKEQEYAASDDQKGIKIRINTSSGSGEEKVFTDMADKKVIEQKDLFGKDFLITGNLESSKWKITGRQKILMDYPVQEAMLVSGKDTILAWFTTRIPVSTGPQGIGGLPGLVLEVSIGSAYKILATRVDLETSVASKIKAPRKGKSVTKEQFEKIMEEKQAEMAEQYQQAGDKHSQIKVIRL